MALGLWEKKTKEMYFSSLSLKVISFVLFPQASVPSLNFSKSFSDDFVSKTLFTWSGGPRSSGVTFYCFVSPRA